VIDGCVAVEAIEWCSVAFGSNGVPLVLGGDVLEDHVVEADLVGHPTDNDQSLKDAIPNLISLFLYFRKS